MKKANLSFRAVRCGSYLHRFFLGKNKSRRLRSAAIGAAASICISVSASAQCNIFRNADEANPLLSMLDTTKIIGGFTFADIDGDGDLDAYLSYSAEAYPLPPSQLIFFRNTGTKKHPVFKEDKNDGFGTIKAGHSNAYMQFVDIDGDGDLDFYTSEDAKSYPGFGAIVYYQNVGTPMAPKFISGGDDPIPYTSSPKSQPFAFADVDGDGDYDLYVCDISPAYGFGYNQRIYFNTGTKTKGVFNDDYRYNTIDELSSRTYFDWNKDGLLDFFGVEDYEGLYGRYIKNTGPLHHPHYEAAAAEGPRFGHGAPYRMVDLNGDGAPEVFDFSAHYSTFVPVAVIKDSILQNGKTALYGANRAAGYSYRWELNGNTIAGANHSYIVPKQPGTYTLYITDGCGTGVSLNYEFKRNSAFAEADSKDFTAAQMNAVGVKAYPNPFTETFTLQLPGSLCTVKITDMAGRELLKQTTSAASLQTGQSLKAGTYIVQVLEGKELVYMITVIKQ